MFICKAIHMHMRLFLEANVHLLLAHRCGESFFEGNGNILQYPYGLEYMGGTMMFNERTIISWSDQSFAVVTDRIPPLTQSCVGYPSRDWWLVSVSIEYFE